MISTPVANKITDKGQRCRSLGTYVKIQLIPNPYSKHNSLYFKDKTEIEDLIKHCHINRSEDFFHHLHVSHMLDDLDQHSGPVLHCGAGRQ